MSYEFRRETVGERHIYLMPGQQIGDAVGYDFSPARRLQAYSLQNGEYKSAGCSNCYT